MHRHTLVTHLSIAVVALAAGTASAWDASGHRTVAWLALDALPADAPPFLKEQATRDAVTWNAAEPDRWRGEKNPFLMNGTYMDHYFDVEDLEEYGMTLQTLPMLRYRFVREITLARAKWPNGKSGTSKPYVERRDPTGQQEFPGFAVYAICEQQARLTNQFKTWRMLKKLSDPDRDAQIKMAEANILSTMGVLAHFAGDTAQPLHTTKHHHGWAAGTPNPEGFTTDYGFHALIDGGLIRKFDIDYAACKAAQVEKPAGPPPEQAMNAKDAASSWGYTISYLQRIHERVVPLYELEKSGKLFGPEGKAFIIMSLNDGGAALGAYYASAWAASEPTDKEVDDFIRYDGFKGSSGIAPPPPPSDTKP
ncbi:MAG: hypothetical protein Q8L55_08995 [Phycisphaerales bacterium]|nr:hypothetical protein [Phycisphaerales bacterium]